VRSGVVAVDPAAEHGHRRACRLERTAVRLRVDAAREPADDDEPRRGEIAPEAARDLAPVRRARAGTDHRHRRPRQQLGLAGAAEEEARRRVVDRAQQRRVRLLRAREEAEAERREPIELGPRVEALGERREARAARCLDEVRVARGGERRECELVHAASSRGER
jgi:hypothetical protein